MRLFIVAIVAVVGLAFVWSAKFREPVVATASSADPHLSDSDMPYVEPPAAVGWVFGRVMGFPGADRPLMSGSYPTMPPAVRSASALAGPRQ